MSLNQLLRLQLIYCCLGILFNIVSWWGLMKTGQSLTPINPISGMLAMGVFGLFLLSGKMKWIAIYRVLMLLAIFIFGYGGIIKHIITLYQTPELYPYFSVGIIAILINVFGLFLNTYAALGWFKTDKN